MFVTQWLNASSPNLTISVWIILCIGVYIAFLKLWDYVLSVTLNFEKLSWGLLWTCGANLATYSLASPILALYSNSRIQMTIFAAIFINLFLPVILSMMPSRTVIEREDKDEELTDEVVMQKLAVINNKKKSDWEKSQFIIGLLISIGLIVIIYIYINKDPDNLKTFAKMFSKQLQ